MNISPLGQIVGQCWADIPDHRPYVVLDAFVIMPNHIHGIIFITETEQVQSITGDASVAATGSKKVQGHSLSAIIGSFKSAVTKNVHRAGMLLPKDGLWQRNYYDHIIRDETSLAAIRNYIVGNPSKWELDEYFSCC